MHRSGIDQMEPGDSNRATEGRIPVLTAGGVDSEYAQTRVEGFQKALNAEVKIACGGDSGPIWE